MNSIKNTIRAFDENLMISSDSIKFRKELMNISGILSTLMVYAVEYGMEYAITDLRDKKRMVEELTNEANAGNLSFKSTTTEQNIVNIYQEVIVKIFKKIYFDINIDSIQKILPSLPDDPHYEFLGDVISIMYSILKSINLLRGKINQSFVPATKFYKDYLMSRYSHFINLIVIDYDDLRQLLMEEMAFDIDTIDLNDDLKIRDYLSNLKDKLREGSYKKEMKVYPS